MTLDEFLEDLDFRESNTLYQKHENVHVFPKGFRKRIELQMFGFEFLDQNFWFLSPHAGYHINSPAPFLISKTQAIQHLPNLSHIYSLVPYRILYYLADVNATSLSPGSMTH